MEKRPNLAYRIPSVVIAPLEGDDAKAIYEAAPEVLRVNTRYDEKTKAVIGSTNLLAVGIDDVVRNLGLRTLNLADLSLPEVMNFAQGKHYLDARTLVARSISDSDYEKNNPLLKRISELVEEKEGTIRFPFMIEGFSYVPDESRGYGVTLVQKPDFNIVHDERLLGKYSGEKFNSTDKFGLPLFDNNGSRTWYTRDASLSRLYLNRNLYLGSGSGNLTGSDDNGRVVVVSTAEGGSQSFLDEKLTELQRTRDEEITKINERYQRAENVLRGK